jgi:hypothetical protein
MVVSSRPEVSGPRPARAKAFFLALDPARLSLRQALLFVPIGKKALTEACEQPWQYERHFRECV